MTYESTRGKTTQPEARKILAKYEEKREFGGTVSFTGLTLKDAKRLLEIGAMDPEETQNGSPSIREFIKLAEKYKGMTFHGYRVVPDREDERITIEGFHVPSKLVGRKAFQDLASLGADEFDDTAGKIRAWWD